MIFIGELYMDKIEELREELFELRNNGAEIEDIALLIQQIQLEEVKAKEKYYNYRTTDYIDNKNIMHNDPINYKGK